MEQKNDNLKKYSRLRENLENLQKIEFGKEMSEQEIINTMVQLKKLKELMKLADDLFNN